MTRLDVLYGDFGRGEGLRDWSLCNIQGDRQKAINNCVVLHFLLLLFAKIKVL